MGGEGRGLARHRHDYRRKRTVVDACGEAGEGDIERRGEIEWAGCRKDNVRWVFSSRSIGPLFYKSTIIFLQR